MNNNLNDFKNTISLIGKLSTNELNGTLAGIRGPRGEKGDIGPQGVQGIKGDTPLKGKDYWTPQDKQEIVKDTKTAVIPLIEDKIGNKVTLSIDKNYLMKLELLNPKGVILSTASVDFPIESMVVNASYINGVITLTLQNGQTLNVNISDIVEGLVNETTFNNVVKQINAKIRELEQKYSNDITRINTEQIAQNNNIQTNKDLIEKLSIKPKVQGTRIHIEDSSNLKPLNFNIHGNSIQETTEGKQLYDNKNLYSQNYSKLDENNWITSTYDNTKGTFKVFPDLVTNAFPQIKANTEYALIIEVKEKKGKFSMSYTTDYAYSGNITQFETNQYFLDNSINLGKTKYIIKTRADISQANMGLRTIMGINPGDNASITYRMTLVENIDINEKDYIYELYTGGVASPNSEYPSEVECVGAYNELDTNSNKWQQGFWNYTSDGSYNANSTTRICMKKIFNTELKTYTFIGKNNWGIRVDGWSREGKYLGRTSILDWKDFTEKDNKVNFIIAKYIYYSITLASTEDKFTLSPTNIKELDNNTLMLYEGTEEKPYLPYGNIGIKNTGKNLFNKNNVQVGMAMDGDTGELKQNNYYHFCGYISVKPDTKYIRSNVGTSTNICLDKNKNYLGKVADTKFTTLPNTAYIGFNMTKEKYENQEYLSFAINEGNVLTNEPYKETITHIDLKGNELCKIGETKDLLNIDSNGRTTIDKRFAKYVFTGEEYFFLSNKNDYQWFATSILNFKKGKLLSNYFMYKDRIGNYIGITNQGTNNRIYISVSNEITTVDQLKQFLKDKYNSGNSVYVTYELETPEKIELPRTELRFLYEGINNIEVLANIDTELEVNYIADTKKYIDNRIDKLQKVQESINNEIKI